MRHSACLFSGGSWRAYGTRPGLSFGVADMVTYDGTYDPRSKYDPTTGGPIKGDGPGRSIELYGAGYRNGFTPSSVLEEHSICAARRPAAEGVRNIFATDSVGGGSRDVSSNFRDALDPVPFAIGQVAAGDLNSDDTMKGEIDVVFALNLLNLDVVSYLQTGLDGGRSI